MQISYLIYFIVAGFSLLLLVGLVLLPVVGVAWLVLMIVGHGQGREPRGLPLPADHPAGHAEQVADDRVGEQPARVVSTTRPWPRRLLDEPALDLVRQRGPAGVVEHVDRQPLGAAGSPAAPARPGASRRRAPPGRARG